MTERERIEKFLESINEDNVRGFFNTLIEICNLLRNDNRLYNS